MTINGNVNALKNLWSSKLIPSITLAIRKDHNLFNNKNGNKMIDNLYKSYLSYKLTYPQYNIPIFLPKTLDTQKVINMSKNNEVNSINIESCVALHIDYNTYIYNNNNNNNTSTEAKEPVNAFITSFSSKNYNKIYYDSNAFPAELVTHISVNDISSENSISNHYIRKNFHFLLNCENWVLPERMHIDSLLLTDYKNNKYPINFNVVVAGDKELNIDDEWDNIQDWAKKSG